MPAFPSYNVIGIVSCPFPCSSCIFIPVYFSMDLPLLQSRKIYCRAIPADVSFCAGIARTTPSLHRADAAGTLFPSVLYRERESADKYNWYLPPSGCRQCSVRRPQLRRYTPRRRTGQWRSD